MLHLAASASITAVSNPCSSHKETLTHSLIDQQTQTQKPNRLNEVSNSYIILNVRHISQV